MAKQGQTYGTSAPNSASNVVPPTAQHYNDYILPASSRTVSFKLGIALAILSAVTVTYELACFDNSIYNVLTYSGINVWGGLLYGCTGALSLASHYNLLNYYVTHAYYYSSIISVLASIIQFVLSLVSFRRHRFIWYIVITLLLSMVAIGLTVSCFLILYRNIYRYKRISSNSAPNYANFSNADHGVPTYPPQPSTQTVPNTV